MWDPFWVSADTRIVDRPEILYLVCARPVFYLNQVLRTRPPRRHWPALVDEVQAAHAHTRSTWLLFDTIDMSAMHRPLADAGYQLTHHLWAMARHVNEFRSSTQGAVSVRRVADRQTLMHSVTIMEETFGDPLQHDEDELREMLAICIGENAPSVRFVAYDRADEPIATGCMNLHPTLNLAYLWGGSTVPAARGQGAYRALLGARLALARQRGIDTVGVYAMGDTSAPILERSGFRRCGVMEKWFK